MAWCQKKIYAQVLFKKKKSSVNFLVRAEFLTARPPDRPLARQTARLWWLLYPTVLMAEG